MLVVSAVNVSRQNNNSWWQFSINIFLSSATFFVNFHTVRSNISFRSRSGYHINLEKYFVPNFFSAYLWVNVKSKEKKSAQYLFKNHSEIPLTFRPVKKRSNLMVFDHFDRNSSTLKTQFWIYEWSKSKYFWYFFKKKRFSDQPGEIKFSKYAPETDWNDTFERTVRLFIRSWKLLNERQWTE